MSASRFTLTLSNGARVSMRPDMQATWRSGHASQRTFWRYVCRGADGKIVARGSDLSTVTRYSWQTADVYRDAQVALCSLLSFAGYYSEVDVAESDPENAALGAWYDANDSELESWRCENDPELRD